MPRRVHHSRLVPAPTNRIPFAQKLLHFCDLRRLNAQPFRLHVQFPVQLQITLVHKNRRAGDPVQRRQPAHMIDMRMRADNRQDLQLVTIENLDDALHLIARIDDDRFMRLRIAKNRAIALQHADGNNFVNQILRHSPKYIRSRPSGLSAPLASLR